VYAKNFMLRIAIVSLIVGAAIPNVNHAWDQENRNAMEFNLNKNKCLRAFQHD
jgi:hypothetical protein